MRAVKRLLAGLLALALMLAGALTVSAEDGNVTYHGSAGEFIFAPGSEYSPTDLFPNFKDVMPGDSLHQTIFIQNDRSKDVKIKVYMRSLGAHADSEAFLSKLDLRVEQLPGAVIYEAPADQTAQLTDWVYLGLVYSGGQVELDVVLDVPVTLDNKDKNMIGYLDWEFMIQELPAEDTDPQPPQTGDASPVWLYITVAAGSGALLLLLLFLRPRKKD